MATWNMTVWGIRPLSRAKGKRRQEPELNSWVNGASG
jgi:hypothetical protein